LAIAQTTNYFDSDDFLADLTRQIAFRTERKRAGPCGPRAYLEQETVPAAHRLVASPGCWAIPPPAGRF